MRISFLCLVVILSAIAVRMAPAQEPMLARGDRVRLWSAKGRAVGERAQRIQGELRLLTSDSVYVRAYGDTTAMGFAIPEVMRLDLSRGRQSRTGTWEKGFIGLLIGGAAGAVIGYHSLPDSCTGLCDLHRYPRAARFALLFGVPMALGGMYLGSGSREVWQTVDLKLEQPLPLEGTAAKGQPLLPRE